MLGRHSVERMPAFFRRADALLVTLKDEPIFAMTIPGKLQAYLVAGMPIIGMLAARIPQPDDHFHATNPLKFARRSR